MELEFNFERQKNYIINNIQHPNITYNTILNEIEQYHPTDTAWALLIPSGVCMACASSLFSEIANLSVDANSFYLISEIPFEKLKREWYSHKFKHYSVAKNNSTFQHFNSNIYIAKLIQHDKKIEIFMYDSDLYEFLPYFILDKIIEASVQGKSGTNTLTCQNTFGSCIAWHPDGASKIQRGYVDDNKTKTKSDDKEFCHPI